jgi:5-methylcytosine-specific restriction endonuclease McrA
MYYGEGSIRLETDQLRPVFGGGEEMHLCHGCHRFYPKEAMTIDHRTPWANLKKFLNQSREQQIDGYNDITDLQLLCYRCNASKSNKAFAGRGSAGGYVPISEKLSSNEAQDLIKAIGKDGLEELISL